MTIKLFNGLLMQVKDELSDEIDLAPMPDTSDYEKLKLELLEAKKEAKALSMLLAAKSAEVARLGGQS